MRGVWGPAAEAGISGKSQNSLQIGFLSYNLQDMNYIARFLGPLFIEYLQTFPAVLIWGSRQCGESTFVAHELPHFEHFDLERPADFNLISSVFFHPNPGRCGSGSPHPQRTENMAHRDQARHRYPSLRYRGAEAMHGGSQAR